jgi:hypothetical protein
MKHRIAIWASVGFLVAVFWAIYLFPTSLAVISDHPFVWTVVRLTQPAVFAIFYLHPGLRVYWVVVANAATYAMVGVLVETLLRVTRNRFQAAPEPSN